ncbi:MAG: right-handed parallel beta-helix repeat-containing protein [Thermoflexales bacterium]|nr:right-handed parallel beta-helix repeat-containing protein [Thermoflexales bacterium]
MNIRTGGIRLQTRTAYLASTTHCGARFKPRAWALWVGTFAAAGALLVSGAAHAQLPLPTAQDTASDAAYDPPGGWNTGDNGGFGMGAWTLQTTSGNTSQNGHFVGNSINNNPGSSDSNGDGDINTAPGNRAWGLYANSGQTASAIRTFNDSFTPGSVFEIFMDNGNVQSGGTVGFALQNASGQDLLEVYFIGGGTHYTVHGDTPTNSGVAFTREGIRVVVTLTTASTYQATLTRLVDGQSSTVSGALRNNPGPISRLRLFNANAGSGSTNDLFFNRITYYRGRVLNVNTGRGYLNIQPAIDDPNTQPGHTLNIAAGTYTGTQNNPVTINKHRLTLVGAGTTSTVILKTAPGTMSGIQIANGITGTTISSLRVQGFNNGGICGALSNHFTTITNTHVFSNTGSSCLGGIYLNGPVQHVTISHNEAAFNTSHGIVIRNKFKQHITITHNYVYSNNCCGIELQDGTASGVLIAHNLVRDNFDSGIGTVGLTSGAGPNLVYNNTLYNNGRFGIEIKLPDGTGLTSGDGSIYVLSNTVELTAPIGTIKLGELRDLAGIAAFRRAWVPGENNVDIPTGVVIEGNTVRGYTQPSASEGFGIVVEGANMTVISNTIENNEVGLQGQAGHTPYAPFTTVDGDQSNLSDQFFGRGNSPQLCGYTFSGNSFSNNGTDTRLINPTSATVTNLNSLRVACTIQSALDAPSTANGHTLSLSPGTFTGTVTVRKAVRIAGAGPGQSVVQSLSPGIIVTQSNVIISNTSVVGTGANIGITTTFGVTGLTVSNVHISNFAQGVGLLGGHSHVVQNSVFTLTNVVTSVGVGMAGSGLANPITNVVVSGNVFTASGYAVAGVFANQNQIVGNVMRNGIAGVRMAGANNNTVASNQIENNALYAIYFAPDVPPLISTPIFNNNSNVISGNIALNHPNDRGIQIINVGPKGNGNQIINNQLVNVGGPAIFIGAGSGDQNLLIAGNQISGVITTTGSIVVAPADNITVTSNAITNGAGPGIVVGEGQFFLVQGNTVISHAAGINAANLDHVRLLSNVITGVIQHGAFITGAGNVTVTSNLINAQGGALGIRLQNLGTAYVAGNAAQGYAQRGLSASGMTALTALTNTFTGGDFGIHFTSAGSGLISGNTLSNTAQAGVFASGTGSTDAFLNTLENNNVAVRIDPTGLFTLSGQPALYNTFRNNTVNITTTDSSSQPNVNAFWNDWGVYTVQGVENSIYHQEDNATLRRVNFVTLTASVAPTTALAGGADAITLTLSVTGLVGSDLSGTVITLTSSGAPNVNLPVTVTTNAQGIATVVLTSTTAGSETITASVPGSFATAVASFTGATLVIEKVLSGLITPTTAWQFTVTVPTGTLAFTLPASGGVFALSGLDTGQAFITETTKLGYVATSACSNGASGGSSISLNLIGTVTCTFTNTINPVTTVITVTPVVTNGWGYITETVTPGTFPIPFDIVLSPPTPTLGNASARFVITNVNWRHMYTAPVFTGTRLSDITVFEYRIQFPAVNGLRPYINIGWDDDVTDGNTGLRGRLVHVVDGLAPNTWHIIDARNDPTPRWYTTLSGATQCTDVNPCTFAQLVAAYPNAAIHPGQILNVPLGFIGIRTGGESITGTGYADGLRVGVGNQVTLYNFEAASPTTITLTTHPTTTSVATSATLTATVQVANGDPVIDGTVVTFTTSLGAVAPITTTTVGGVATATVSSTIAGVATLTATVDSLSATVQVTFTPGAAAAIMLTAVPTTTAVGTSSTLTATVVDQFGNPVANGTVVSFTTSLGTLGSSSASTLGGNAVVTLTSTTAGVATVAATVGTLSTTVQVTFTPGAAAAITLTAVPTTTAVGTSSTLTATVVDQFGNAVASGTVVSFATSLGTLSSASASTLGGNAFVTLTSTTAGVATVAATVGTVTATAKVTFTAGPAFTVSLSLSPTVIFANGISQSLATATVVDQFGNPVSNVTVLFLAGVGQFSPSSGSTGANGQVTATLTSLIPAVENVFAAVGGVGFASAQATYVNLPASLAPITSTLSTVTQSLGVVRKGDLITYTVRITNTGSAQINNVLIVAPIPSGTTYVLGSAQGGNFNSSFATLILSDGSGMESVLGPQAALNSVTWAGNLAGGASHTLSYAVKVQVLEGQIVNQPQVFVDNALTGINLASTVDVVAYKGYLPIVRRQ